MPVSSRLLFLFFSSVERLLSRLLSLLLDISGCIVPDTCTKISSMINNKNSPIILLWHYFFLPCPPFLRSLFSVSSVFHTSPLWFRSTYFEKSILYPPSISWECIIYLSVYPSTVFKSTTWRGEEKKKQKKNNVIMSILFFSISRSY